MLFEKIVFSVFSKVCNSSLVEFNYASQVIEKIRINLWFLAGTGNFSLTEPILLFAKEFRLRKIEAVLLLNM